MKINVLDPSVYNRIAAGEVVERPVSVVKELMENAIDAGANAIIVRIEEGGIKRIEVEDDGVGIPKEELKKTILPHATSKLSDENELYSIATLGFRGEALASISSVSEFSIKSRYIESDIGAILTTRGGEDVTVKDIAKNANGTTVTVNKLFFNVPARYKFLKTRKTEENYITSLITEMILANPHVNITYFIDGKLILTSEGGGLFSAVKAVYSGEIASAMIPIVPSENGFVQVSGFCCAPGCTKHNRDCQTIIINGRVVSDQNISATVQNAYAERLMQRTFPIFVINVLIPFESVDVNVHPNKREVRFEHPKEVYSAIYNAVKFALEEQEAHARRAILSKAEAECIAVEKEEQECIAVNDVCAYDGENPDDGHKEEPKSLGDLVGTDFKVKFDSMPKVLHFAEGDSDISSDSQKDDDEENLTTPLYQSDLFLGKSKDESKEKEAICAENPCLIPEFKNNYRVIGQAFATYLIVESDNKLIYIDQHAAHERLLYDELIEKIKHGEVYSQQFLMPYIYEATPSTMSAITAMFDDLRKIGFEIEEFGRNSIRISAVPEMLTDINLEAFFAEIASKDTLKITLEDALKEKLAVMACKAAIKGGDALNRDQIEAFMARLSNGNMPLMCPHGRPTYYTITKFDLEKTFKRRV